MWDDCVAQIDDGAQIDPDWMLVAHPKRRLSSQGTTERWCVFDATNGRYTRLVLDGAPMVVVALDGSMLAKPLTVSELLLAPGQRAELVVLAPTSSGQRLVLRTVPYILEHEAQGMMGVINVIT